MRRAPVSTPRVRYEDPSTPHPNRDWLNVYVDIPKSFWEPVGENYGARPNDLLLAGPLRINGLALHVNAMRVKPIRYGEHPGEYSEQGAAHHALEEEFDRWFRLYDGEAWETTEIEGFKGEYVIVLHPYS